MDRLISSYTIKGKRINSITLDEDITDMCAFTIKRTKLNELLLVALASGEIRLYRGIQVIHSFFVQKPVIAMRFGPYGREENSLIVIHGRGSLMIKIWRRTADVDAAINVIGAPPEQDIPLQVPKKTKLYVEQTERERNFAPEMHRTFQRDLSRLRLETARAYVKTLTDVNIVSFYYLSYLLFIKLFHYSWSQYIIS
jgi:Bardet-Biedl syndrome 1 protein